MSDFDFLYDHTEDTSTRFVCFISPSMCRFDLAILNTNRFYGKKLIINLQSGKSAVIGPDDLDEEGYLEHVFKLGEEEAEELRSFLYQIVGTVNFTDI
ncbi:DUF3055 domain-containing protein [Paenibacillus sp. FJAT-26967]|uniref:DUF3055 domain-containing protein n=1 Tax=Paenibacillus sp. FJAT-26967 TaxID=1729690 RepID=UPI000837C591|nr:DUF3055 domain-containing protein [Paenibacillus sp. FJAT-26967]